MHVTRDVERPIAVVAVQVQITVARDRSGMPLLNCRITPTWLSVRIELKSLLKRFTDDSATMLPLNV